MTTIEEIREAINKFDPESAKMEAEDDIQVDDGSNKNISTDNYQDAIDDVVDPEDLNFSMDPFDTEDEEGEESTQLAIPQSDADKEPIKVGDKVKKLTRDMDAGEVIAVGELVEVQWTEELITMEYPEELVHAEDIEEEMEKLVSIDNDPPEEEKNTEQNLQKSDVEQESEEKV